MSAQPLPPEQVTVTVSVAVAPAVAFEVFTAEMDLWWKRGPRFRASGRAPGVLHLEPRLGGRLFETVRSEPGAPVTEVGRVIGWDPPSLLKLEWRSPTFGPLEKTEVEVRFEPSARGTRVTVVHRGWEEIRADHPVRHGQDPEAFLRQLGLWWGELMTALRMAAEGRAQA